MMKCIVIEDDRVARLLVEKYSQKIDYLEFQAAYSSAVEALNDKHVIENVDLIFLDVEMPHMTGVEFLDTLKNPPLIIIISSQGKYAVDAIEYDVTDYVLKPISFPRFHKAVEKAHAKFKRKNEHVMKDDGMFVKNSTSSLVRLKYEDILWIEAMENYIVINTFEQRHTIHFTMKSILEKLPSSIFTRIHRSYIVNIHKIDMIEENTIVMKTKLETKYIPIAKTYKDNLMEHINIVSK